MSLRLPSTAHWNADEIGPGDNPIRLAMNLSDTSDGRPSAPRSVRALEDGVVGVVGWQNPKKPGAGMGWRIYIDMPDGSRVGYGHMDPASTLKPGTKVKRGDVIGSYADPTNGHSSGPHVHRQKFNPRGQIADPGDESPLAGKGRMSSRFGRKDRMHPRPHQGVDWKED